MAEICYFLKQILHNGHTQCVRCCCYLKEKQFLVSGGLDGQIIVWNHATPQGTSETIASLYEHFNVLHKSNPHIGFVLSLCESHDGETFYSGGGDNKILRHSSTDFSVISSFHGHNGPVNSIIEKSLDELITGSWDGTARIWDTTTSQCKKVLSGHNYAVSLCLLPDNTLLTGSQEKSITFWKDFNKHHSIKDAHKDIIRKMAVINDGFLSVSNDSSIKLWLTDGTEVTNFSGHNSFIFDVAVSKCHANTFFTTSEDHSLKIWDLNSTESIQTIRHPATVWQIIETPQGDLITSCEDGNLYLWSSLEEDALPVSMREQFEATVENVSEDPGKQININNLPDYRDMGKYRGKKQGDTKIFRENDKAVAYQWDLSGWKKIGEVVDSAPPKTYYPGDNIFSEGEYDYVFDVEIESRQGAKKLPYNIGDNMLLVAENFCSRESISKENCQQIIAFIQQNTASRPSGDAPSQNSLPTNQHKSHLQEKPKTRHFPITKYISFSKLNTDIIIEKIINSNNGFEEGKLYKLNESQIEKLKNCLLKLGSKDFIRKTFNEGEFYLLFKELIHWPVEDFLPIMDIWRAVALHPDISNLFKGTDNGWQFIAIALKYFSQSPDGPLGICSLRFLVNLFEFSTVRNAMIRWQTPVLESLNMAPSSNNKAIRVAVTSLLYNYSRALHELSAKKVAKLQVFEKLKDLIKNESTPECFYKCLVSLGTLLYNDYDFILDIAQSNFLKILETDYIPKFLEDKSIDEAHMAIKNYIES